MLSPLVKQEIALAKNNIHDLIKQSQISSSWRSVCNSNKVWRKHYQQEFKIASNYKESTLLWWGFYRTYKYLCYTVPNGHALSRSEVLREYKIIEHRLFMLCKARCSMRAHCIRREGERVVFYYSITCVFMNSKEFVDFLYSFSTFTPLITREPLPIDYNIFAYEVLIVIYALALALLMSPLLYLLLWLFSRLC
nr:putative membrane protein [Cedratvirus lena]